MMFSERSLTHALRQHLTMLGRDPKEAEKVLLPDGSAGRLDLVLSAKTKEHDRIRHLVVELKAPAVRATDTQCQRWLIVASRADSKCAQSSSQGSSAGSACIRDNSPWSWESSSAENPAKASRSTSATATSIDATARLPSAVISTI